MDHASRSLQQFGKLNLFTMLSTDDDSLPLDDSIGYGYDSGKTAAFDDFSLSQDAEENLDFLEEQSHQRKITQAWINERCAPALLGFEKDAFEGF